MKDEPRTLERVHAEAGSRFGVVLKEHRLAAGLSQEGLAERARMSVDAISALERGTRRSPRRDTVALICDALALDGAARSAFIATADGAREPHGPASRRAADHDAHNLPLSLTMLHGRDRDLSSVSEQLEAHRLVTLTGFGGVGKTRLAIETGWRLLGRFPDGVHLVELAPVTDVYLVAQRVATALGVPTQAEQLGGDLWIDAVREKRCLVILDNCEHVLDAATTVALRLLQRCPELRVLATSREPLRIPGERVVHLAPLTLPAGNDGDDTIEGIRSAPAVTMFLDRVADVAPDFPIASADASTWTSVRNVCTRLDGIPLALELAAARVPALGLDALERGLRDRFRLLTGGARTSLPRQQTLEATLDWSYEALTPGEQCVFDRLGVFAGGFGADAVVAVCACDDGDEPDVVAALGHLVEKSLVVVDSAVPRTRYRLLETTRAYALRRLSAAGTERDARLRHAGYFHGQSARLRHSWGTRPLVEWAEQYHVELDNFRAALVWSIDERGDLRLGAEMLCNLTRLIEWFALHAELIRWCERTIAAFGADAPPLIEAELLLTAVRQHNALGAFHTSLPQAQRAAELCRAHGADVGLAYALTLSGKALACDPARRDEADRALDEAIAIFTTQARPDEAVLHEPDKARFSMAALALAFKAFSVEPVHVDRRRGYLLDALEQLRALIPGHWIIGVLHAFVSDLELEVGDYDTALHWAEQSMASYQGPGSRYGYIFALNAAATVRFAMGDGARARSCAGELLAFARRIGSAPGFAMALIVLAALEADARSFTSAAGLLGAWEASPSRMDTPIATMTYLLSRARPAIVDALGEAGFARALRAGARWSVDEAMATASAAAEPR